MKNEQNNEQLKEQAFADEWGPIENVSFNEKTGQPVPQPKNNDELK